MSHTINHDPINGAIYDGIKRGIEVCLKSRCFGSAVILIYSGIDTMAFLGMPAKSTAVTGGDFEQWCDKYIVFPGQQQLTGREIYSARCAMLHTFGVESSITRRGECRTLAYMDVSVPAIRYSVDVDPTLALVSIEALARAFFDGIDRFLVELFADPSKALAAEQRLKQLVVAFHSSRIT